MQTIKYGSEDQLWSFAHCIGHCIGCIEYTILNEQVRLNWSYFIHNFLSCDSYLHFNESLMSLCGQKNARKFFSKENSLCALHTWTTKIRSFDRNCAHGNDKTTLINSFLLRVFSRSHLENSSVSFPSLLLLTRTSSLSSIMCVFYSRVDVFCVCVCLDVDAFRHIENILLTSSLKSFVWLNSFRAPVHCIGE